MPAPRPRVLVTRSPRQASALADRLRELGAEPVLVPCIETVDPASFAALDEALTQLSTFDWLLFTSSNGAEAFGRRLPAMAPPFQMPKIAAIGAATARALARIGLAADLVPAQAVAESLAEALLPHARRSHGSSPRFLLVRAEEAREHLPEVLRAAGAEVTIAPAYRTIVHEGSMERVRELFGSRAAEAGERIAAVSFTSASTVRNFFALLAASGCALPPEVVRASIGPITSIALFDLGLPRHVEAPQATVESLAGSLVEYLAGQEHG